MPSLQRASTARKRVPPRLSLALDVPDGVEQCLCAMRYRIVDHLAVDLDRRGAAALRLAEGGDDAPGGGQLVGARHVGSIHRRDLVGVHAAASLEAAAAAAL